MGRESNVDYKTHDILGDLLRAQFNMAAAGFSAYAAGMKMAAQAAPFPAAYNQAASQASASAALAERFGKTYRKPEFGLKETLVGGQAVAVTETAAAQRPWCTLRRFEREGVKPGDPKVLVVAPMSGHYATLLRDTVKSLLPHHDVYITDWHDAREVPLESGAFGLEDYIAYLQDFMRELGPGAHVIAVCQSTVPALAAIADLAATGDKNQPASLSLLSGPVDTRAAPTEVSKFGARYPLDWFARNVIAEVPSWYKGAGQKTYPGFLQLAGFVSLNPQKHADSHADFFNHILKGNEKAAGKIAGFYDEYFATSDMPSRFYLDTIDHVFQNQTLAKGEMKFQGRLIDLSKIKKTSLLTIEGSEDNITAPGQTVAAQKLCAGLPPSKKFNLLQQGVGHYGVFSGHVWREEICPKIAGFIREAGAQNGVKYNYTAEKLGIPGKWPAPTDKHAGHFPQAG